MKGEAGSFMTNGNIYWEGRRTTGTRDEINQDQKSCLKAAIVFTFVFFTQEHWALAIYLLERHQYLSSSLATCKRMIRERVNYWKGKKEHSHSRLPSNLVSSSESESEQLSPSRTRPLQCYTLVIYVQGIYRDREGIKNESRGRWGIKGLLILFFTYICSPLSPQIIICVCFSTKICLEASI
jgi:hypothetical protein